MPDIETGDAGRATARPVRVLIVQDQPMVASEIAAILGSERELVVVGVARTGEEAFRATAQHQPSVVLMDYRLQDMSGPAAAEMILAANSAGAIVFYSADDSEKALLDAIDAGATGYLTKETSAAQLVEAVRRAARGDSLIPAALFVKAIARQRSEAAERVEREKVLATFTPRELEVLQLLAAGLSTDQISGQLGLAPHTVDWHVRHLIEKLAVHSRLQAVIAAARLGLVNL